MLLIEWIKRNCIQGDDKFDEDDYVIELIYTGNFFQFARKTISGWVE